MNGMKKNKKSSAGHVPVELRFRTSGSLLFFLSTLPFRGVLRHLWTTKQALRYALFLSTQKQTIHMYTPVRQTTNKPNTDLSDSYGHLPQRPRLRPEELFPQLPLPVSDQLLPPFPYRLCAGHDQCDHDDEEERLRAAALIIILFSGRLYGRKQKQTFSEVVKVDRSASARPPYDSFHDMKPTVTTPQQLCTSINNSESGSKAPSFRMKVTKTLVHFPLCVIPRNYCSNQRGRNFVVAVAVRSRSLHV